MDRRYQVFISSTFTDLKDERREVIQALLELDCLPAGMEMFPAANDDQWTLIKRVINQSDFYVVIVGGRYGSMSEQGMSYTEMEYDYAVQQEIPVLGFVHADPGSIPANKTEMDAAARERLDKFRAKVQTKHVKMYNGAEDLGSKVSRALNIAMRGTDAEGWVRGRYAMTPEAETEVAQLRAQVAELKQEAQSAKAAKVEIPDDLASGADVYEMQLTIDFYSAAALYGQMTGYAPAEILHHETTVPVTWDEVMAELAPRLVDEASEQELANALDSYGQRLLLGDHNELLPSSLGELVGVHLASQAFDDILMQLFALNVTAHGTKPRGDGDRHKYWRLTETGRDTLLRLRAIKKPAVAPPSP
ncbi:DUF4062 domain-containing protein [Arthrobacter sp. NamB2]|uniref:DUF4062 domain-containing protein n=1 Tax=Arthrobacter sp. NamB2 TaxID=2576035 RepID=UPI0010CA17F3|nr:DUF4062 domain-containing protein [Arthrobacter sp. NamB2]TKV27424.1 DUF4062 domain-containing protein [Arthrobacter sp. NamB2]